MKFSGKMYFKIISKVTKYKGFHPLYRRYIFQKTTERGVSIWSPVPSPQTYHIRVKPMIENLQDELYQIGNKQVKGAKLRVNIW